MSCSISLEIGNRVKRAKRARGVELFMTVFKRSRCLVAAAIATGMVFIGGSDSLAATSDAAPKRGGTLEFAVGAEPNNYDCDENVSYAFLQPIAPHYSTLLKFDAANYPRIAGDLAQTWDVSPNGRTYTFRLRPGVLFHDGSKLTSADVKASFERIIRPPAGVKSVRRADYAAISSIDTPDALTVVFHLQWPDASMLANFASPWNCIYSAAKLKEDPLFPRTHILGTGAFVFVEHVKGEHWRGKRWEHYFQPGKPYLDGYQADFMPASQVIPAFKTGRIMAEFRGITPPQSIDLSETMGDKIAITESPWLSNLLIVFNSKRPPFDDARVRRALSLAVDRWGAAQALGETTFLKYVGGIMRPGSSMATPESDLAELPGYSHDLAASRAEAKSLLAAAGVHDLKLTLLVRDIPMPHFAGAKLLADSWKEIGVTTTIEKRDINVWQKVVDEADFDVAQDFTGDFYDDPTIQLTRYISHDLSPLNTSGSTDRFLDALFVGQAVTGDPQERTKMVRSFEQRALSEAYTVPLLWWDRIVATDSFVKGWTITPSHFLGQDLTDVWLDR
jgi:peptide/nickel transport system substrate-binding protein